MTKSHPMAWPVALRESWAEVEAPTPTKAGVGFRGLVFEVWGFRASGLESFGLGAIVSDLGCGNLRFDIGTFQICRLEYLLFWLGWGAESAADADVQQGGHSIESCLRKQALSRRALAPAVVA